jgi:hypothetical protein
VNRAKAAGASAPTPDEQIVDGRLPRRAASAREPNARWVKARLVIVISAHVVAAPP